DIRPRRDLQELRLTAVGERIVLPETFDGPRDTTTVEVTRVDQWHGVVARLHAQVLPRAEIYYPACRDGDPEVRQRARQRLHLGGKISVACRDRKPDKHMSVVGTDDFGERHRARLRCIR